MKARTPCDGVSDPACVARFASYVGAPTETGCRLWTGSTMGQAGKTRHGKFAGGPHVLARRGRAYVGSHVFAWALTHGQVPDGLEIRHDCDEPLCVEVAHMRLGTRADNVRDTLERYVAPTGAEGNGNAKLTHRQAREIHDLTAAGPFSQREIARLYGISQSQVSNIARGASRAYSVSLIEEDA